MSEMFRQAAHCSKGLLESLLPRLKFHAVHHRSPGLPRMTFAELVLMQAYSQVLLSYICQRNCWIRPRAKSPLKAPLLTPPMYLSRTTLSWFAGIPHGGISDEIQGPVISRNRACWRSRWRTGDWSSFEQKRKHVVISLRGGERVES